MSLLSVRDLSVAYGGLTAVDKVSFELEAGQILGLVGESGSGKSTVANGMLRLLGVPAEITGGSVRLGDIDVMRAGEETLRRMRWRDVAVVPQSALSSLNPVLSIGEHFRDTLEPHGAADRAVEAMKRVDLDPVHLSSYPHELSGGMRQRVALALALALTPPLVVMDEPTTALDVVVERAILRRVLELQRELGFAIVFVTHDLALLMEFATHIGVLYAGRMVEHGAVERFRSGASHPYTRGLLAAMPPAIGETREPQTILGAPPRLDDPPSGCRFHPRCPLASEPCRAKAPPLEGTDHRVACWEISC